MLTNNPATTRRLRSVGDGASVGCASKAVSWIRAMAFWIVLRACT
jgi:hypothetical protein